MLLGRQFTIALITHQRTMRYHPTVSPMPELPEVETTLKGITPYLTGQAIASVISRVPALRWPVPGNLGSLSGKVIKRIFRRGKYIVIDLADVQLILHLGMSGHLRILFTAETPKKHDHVDILLSNGHCLRLHDPRRFGALLLTPNWATHPLITSLGPEPLSSDFNADYLHTQLSGRSMPIKNAIMDSHLVVGVGNIYAAESLFRAGIHPTRSAGRISKIRLARLVDAIKEVLTEAIAQGGTTLKDFVGSDGKPGYFTQALAVYGRGGEHCIRCQRTLREIRMAGRSTCYCPGCQR